jgi:hypothetical protein
MINMGIPGGENWLVQWTPETRNANSAIYVYVIDNGIVTDVFFIGYNYEILKFSDFDIMKDIPGIQIGTGSCAVHDYNGDGFNDIFNYGFYGNYFRIDISWYDPEINEMATTEIPFSIIDRRNGPAPIEFIKYKGMEGFQVYYFIPEVAGGRDWAPDPDPKNYKWFFYTWDKEKREFVEVEEVDPKYVEAYTGPVPIQRQTLPTPPPAAAVEEPPVEAAVVITEQPEETALAVTEDTAKNGNFVIIIAIIAGVAAAVGAVVFLAVLRKKGTA